MQLIGKVTDVQKVHGIRGVDIRQSGTGTAFARLLEKENEKNQIHSQSDNGVEDSGTVTVSPSILEGKMNSYNSHAKAAYFYMTFSTTDLKG